MTKYIYNYYKNECGYCGNLCKYELCEECYNLAKEGYITKNERNVWIKNIKKGIENKFYDENKKYTLKQKLLNENEMKFYNTIKHSLNSKYIIIPQVNLQTIIETNTNTRNDELFRNIDFIIYNKKEFIPVLAIELNGRQHYNNEYWKERDKSVKQILNNAELPSVFIDNRVLNSMKNREISSYINKVLKLATSKNKKFISDKENENDFDWTKQLIKTR